MKSKIIWMLLCIATAIYFACQFGNTGDLGELFLAFLFILFATDPMAEDKKKESDHE